MSYNAKSKADEGCSMDFGEGTKCALYGSECDYRGRLRECPLYQQFFVPEKEREKERTKNLKRLVSNIKLK